jgi:hypothetical protein
MSRSWLAGAAAVVAAGLLAGCTGGVRIAAHPPAPAPATTTVPITTTTTTEVPVPAPPPAVRSVVDPAGAPFASVGGVLLVHPSSQVERVGFHQSNHEGAQPLDIATTAVAPTTLEARGRLTGDRTAADVVVEPSSGIRSPVTGRVKRAGGYTLYCKYHDEYLVVAPDGHPSWEVKLLHVAGLQVKAGDRVVAGETPVAAHANQLPFESQVDAAATVGPAWPHVHIEVVDPSIPNRPSPGGGC